MIPEGPTYGKMALSILLAANTIVRLNFNNKTIVAKI